jgi:group I intron endonuclease
MKEKSKSIVYKITNIKNGKVYIGQTTNLKYFHNYYGSGLYISRAIRKHGIKIFKKEILEYCADVKDSNEKEQFYIKKFNSNDKRYGYNLNSGGKNFKHSDESKKKISLSHKKLFLEGKLNHKSKNNPMYGRSVYSVWIDKYSKSKADRLQKIANEKNRLSNLGKNNAFYGKHHTEETKQKVRATIKEKIKNHTFKVSNQYIKAKERAGCL